MSEVSWEKFSFGRWDTEYAIEETERVAPPRLDIRGHITQYEVMDDLLNRYTMTGHIDANENVGAHHPARDTDEYIDRQFTATIPPPHPDFTTPIMTTDAYAEFRRRIRDSMMIHADWVDAPQSDEPVSYQSTTEVHDQTNPNFIPIGQFFEYRSEFSRQHGRYPIAGQDYLNVIGGWVRI